MLCRSARHLAKAKNERRIDRGVVVRLDETYLRSRYTSTHTLHGYERTRNVVTQSESHVTSLTSGSSAVIGRA